MNINFTQIFQDCWNFMCNQQKITKQFIFLFFITSVIFYFVLSQIEPMPVLEGGDNLQDSPLLVNVSKESMFIAIFQQVITMFISAWGIVTFHRISTQQKNSLNQSAAITLQRFGGMIVISIIAFFPLMVGVIESVFMLLQGQSPSILSLIAILLGFFIFMRLSLASTDYLIKSTTVLQAMKTSWINGVKRSSSLCIYCLINYLIIPILLGKLSSILSDNLIFELIILFVSAVVGVFSLLFTYRFYTLFINKE